MSEDKDAATGEALELAPAKMTPIRSWEAHGLRCALVRAPLYGAINGYVRFPGFPYNLAQEVDVHGGVTYDRGDWLGFDTLHSGDWWPGMAEFRSTRYPEDRTWTEDEVAAETERMAASVARLAAAAFLPVGGAVSDPTTVGLNGDAIARDIGQLIAERDSARSAAVRLEQELAEIQRIATQAWDVYRDDHEERYLTIATKALREIVRVCRPDSVDEFEALGAAVGDGDE